jgi:exopolysaccharide production protein ExoZ
MNDISNHQSTSTEGSGTYDLHALVFNEKPRISALDWLRGIAAIWVILHHINITIQKDKYFSATSVTDIFTVGYRGVDLFFVISGFIMTLLIYDSDHTDRNRLLKFVIHRILRIFPLYLIVFTTLFSIASFFGVGANDGFVPTLSGFIYDALLLPRDDLTTFIPVSAWTLTHEMMFYAMCLSSFISHRLYWVLLVSWSTLCGLTFLTEYNVSGMAMPLSPLNIYFLLGAITAVACRKKPNAYRGTFIIPGLTGLLFAFYIDMCIYDTQMIRRTVPSLVYGISFSAIIFSLHTSPPNIILKFDKVMTYLGRISYSLYLIHYPIIIVLAMIISKIDKNASGQALFFVLSIVVTLIAARISYFLIEKPGIVLGRKISSKLT